MALIGVDTADDRHCRAGLTSSECAQGDLQCHKQALRRPLALDGPAQLVTHGPVEERSAKARRAPPSATDVRLSAQTKVIASERRVSVMPR